MQEGKVLAGVDWKKALYGRRRRPAFARGTFSGSIEGPTAWTATAPLLQNAIAAKCFCTEVPFDVANEAVQLFGGNGISGEYLIEKLFRDARVSMIEQGVNDVLGLVGARRILK